MLTKEEAQAEIQRRLTQLQRDFDELRAIADQHQIEFSFMGGTMHYHDWFDYGERRKRPAKTGFFVADAEWQSSGFICNHDPDFYAWQRANWPEDFDEE